MRPRAWIGIVVVNRGADKTLLLVWESHKMSSEFCSQQEGLASCADEY